MITTDSIFMIRKNGQFSTGGRYASWEKINKGKVWTSIKNAQAAVTYYDRDDRTGFEYGIQRSKERIIQLEEWIKRGLGFGNVKLTKEGIEKISKEVDNLKLFITRKYSSFYEGSEIVEFQTKEVKTYPINIEKG